MENLEESQKAAIAAFRRNAELAKQKLMRPSVKEENLDQYEVELKINDLPFLPKAYITDRGIENQELYNFAGAHVIKVGNYVPADEINPSTNIKPQHLLVVGPSRQSLILAIQAVENYVTEASNQMFPTSCEINQLPPIVVPGSSQQGYVKQEPFSSVDCVSKPSNLQGSNSEEATQNQRKNLIMAKLAAKGIPWDPNKYQCNKKKKKLSLSTKDEHNPLTENPVQPRDATAPVASEPPKKKKKCRCKKKKKELSLSTEDEHNPLAEDPLQPRNAIAPVASGPPRQFRDDLSLLTGNRPSLRGPVPCIGSQQSIKHPYPLTRNHQPSSVGSAEPLLNSAWSRESLRSLPDNSHTFRPTPGPLNIGISLTGCSRPSEDSLGSFTGSDRPSSSSSVGQNGHPKSYRYSSLPLSGDVRPSRDVHVSLTADTSSSRNSTYFSAGHLKPSIDIPDTLIGNAKLSRNPPYSLTDHFRPSRDFINSFADQPRPLKNSPDANSPRNGSFSLADSHQPSKSIEEGHGLWLGNNQSFRESPLLAHLRQPSRGSHGPSDSHIQSSRYKPYHLDSSAQSSRDDRYGFSCNNRLNRNSFDPLSSNSLQSTQDEKYSQDNTLSSLNSSSHTVRKRPQNTFSSPSLNAISGKGNLQNTDPCIKMAIVPHNFPDQIVQKNHVDKIEDVLMDKFVPLEDGCYPSLCGSYLEKGALIICCKNEVAKTWLMSAMVGFKPFGDEISLKLVPRKEILRDRRKIFFKAPQELSDKPAKFVMDLLDKQNPAFKIKDWRLISTKLNSRGHTFVYWVNDVIFNVIKEAGYKASLGFSQVYLTDLTRNENIKKATKELSP